MAREIVFKGHDNSIDLILKANATAVDLATVTRMTLTVGTVLVPSTNNATHPLRWVRAGYVTGEARIYLGDVSSLSTGTYDAPLISYGADYVNGLVWGEVPIVIRAQLEATV
jgi:hypothetical protein